MRPLYIFGNDVRQPFFPSGYPWQCIGKVFAWNDPYSFQWSWTGTGVLVSHNTVLTASHVVPWGADPAMIQFIPAYYNGVSTLGPNIYSYVDNAAAYYNEPDPNVDRPAWDFAVLRLIDPLGDSLGWFGGKTYSDSWNDGNYWNLVGYPGDIAGGSSRRGKAALAFTTTTRTATPWSSRPTTAMQHLATPADHSSLGGKARDGRRWSE